MQVSPYVICNLCSSIQLVFMVLAVWWLRDVEVRAVCYVMLWAKPSWLDMPHLLKILHHEMWLVVQWQWRYYKDVGLDLTKIISIYILTILTPKFCIKNCQVSQKLPKYLPMLMSPNSLHLLSPLCTTTWVVFQPTTKHKYWEIIITMILYMGCWHVDRLLLLQSMVLIDWVPIHYWIWLYLVELLLWLLKIPTNLDKHNHSCPKMLESQVLLRYKHWELEKVLPLLLKYVKKCKEICKGMLPSIE